MSSVLPKPVPACIVPLLNLKIFNKSSIFFVVYKSIIGIFNVVEIQICVPVFAGITSIQRANMIPLSEFSPLPPNPRPQRVETPGYEKLRNGGGDRE